MSQSATQPITESDSESPLETQPKILCLAGAHGEEAVLRQRFGDDYKVVAVNSPVRALACLSRGEFAGVYADVDHFSEVFQTGQFVQNERILQGMPDGVLLLASDNTILWGNGRLSEWTGRNDIVGANFYSVLDSPEILGPDYSPFHTALETCRTSSTTLRSREGKYFRVTAAPVIEDGAPEHLVVTLRDITSEVLQQQKLAAIHQAGVELADLSNEEVANMDVGERIELLKSNILHCTQDVLQYDVVEIRMLDPNTGILEPLLEVGMTPEAASRVLYAETTGNGVTGYVAATAQSYLCDDASTDPHYLLGAEGARSSLTVPLMLHDQVIGTFNVESPDSRAFTDSDLQFVEIFARDVAVALNTLELLATEKASTAAASCEAIHSAVAMPIDDILNDSVNVMERYIGHEPEVVERLTRILRNARDIKQVIHKIGQTMAPIEARTPFSRIEHRPLLAGKRILVVDADESVRSAAHALLERYHCVVETAHDASEAVFMVRNLGGQDQYDCIISDIRLPEMSGYQLMMRLQETMGTVPLILMTGFGYDPGHSIVNARKAGLKFVLYKPFRLDQLLEAVEQMVAAAPSDKNEEHSG